MATEPGVSQIKVLRLLAVGRLEERLLRSVLVRLSERLPVPCALQESGEDLELCWMAERNQVDADRLLESVEALPRSESCQTVAISSHDVGNRIFSFFFGRARVDGRAAIVSIARLDPAYYGLPEDRDLLVTRIVKEILHEIGHNAGLRHCEDQDCLMHFSADVESIDLRGRDYCEGCGVAVDSLYAA